MARSPSWFEQLPDILERISAFPAPILDRRTIERLFNVSRRDAFRLLHKFGAKSAGDSLAIQRDELLIQLDAIRGGDTYQAWVRRTGELGEQLSAAREAAPARHILIPVAKHPLAVDSLPPGIHIHPLEAGRSGRLEIEFATNEELWLKLAELARTRARDRQAFDGILDRS